MIIKRLKTVAITLNIIFIFTTTASAAPSVYTVKVDEKLGKIEQRFRGSADKTIIYVQDAHANMSAQKNMAAIINSLVTDTTLVGIEGAIGKYDFNDLRKYPVADAKKKAAEDMVKSGVLIGAEMAQITSDTEYSLFGLEDKELFRDEFRAFYSVQARQSELENEIAQIEEVLELLKDSLFNPELKEFDAKASDYESDNSSLMKYLGTLYPAVKDAGLDLFDYINLMQFQETFVLQQSVNKSSLKTEIKELAEKLAEYWEVRPEEGFTKDEAVNAFRDYKSGHLSERDMVIFLHSSAMKSGYASDAYFNINRMTKYYKKYSLMNVGALMREVLEVNHTLRMNMAKTEAEKKLVDIADRLRLVKQVFALRALKKDVERFNAGGEEFGLDAIKVEVVALAEQAQVLVPLSGTGSSTDASLRAEASRDAALPAGASHALHDGNGKGKAAAPPVQRGGSQDLVSLANQFYSVADERDGAMLGNLIRSMDAEGKDTAVVVAGGYHAERLLSLMKDKGISYVSVMPKIDNAAEDVAYMQRMMGGVVSVDPFMMSRFQWSRFNAAIEGFKQAGLTTENGAIDIESEFISTADRELLKLIIMNADGSFKSEAEIAEAVQALVKSAGESEIEDSVLNEQNDALVKLAVQASAELKDANDVEAMNLVLRNLIDSSQAAGKALERFYMLETNRIFEALGIDQIGVSDQFDEKTALIEGLDGQADLIAMVNELDDEDLEGQIEEKVSELAKRVDDYKSEIEDQIEVFRFFKEKNNITTRDSIQGEYLIKAYDRYYEEVEPYFAAKEELEKWDEIKAELMDLKSRSSDSFAGTKSGSSDSTTGSQGPGGYTGSGTEVDNASTAPTDNSDFGSDADSGLSSSDGSTDPGAAPIGNDDVSGAAPGAGPGARGDGNGATSPEGQGSGGVASPGLASQSDAGSSTDASLRAEASRDASLPAGTSHASHDGKGNGEGQSNGEGLKADPSATPLDDGGLGEENETASEKDLEENGFRIESGMKGDNDDVRGSQSRDARPEVRGGAAEMARRAGAVLAVNNFNNPAAVSDQGNINLIIANMQRLNDILSGISRNMNAVNVSDFNAAVNVVIENLYLLALQAQRFQSLENELTELQDNVTDLQLSLDERDLSGDEGVMDAVNDYNDFAENAVGRIETEVNGFADLRNKVELQLDAHVSALTYLAMYKAGVDTNSDADENAAFDAGREAVQALIVNDLLRSAADMNANSVLSKNALTGVIAGARLRLQSGVAQSIRDAVDTRSEQKNAENVAEKTQVKTSDNALAAKAVQSAEALRKELSAVVADTRGVPVVDETTRQILDSADKQSKVEARVKRVLNGPGDVDVKRIVVTDDSSKTQNATYDARESVLYLNSELVEESFEDAAEAYINVDFAESLTAVTEGFVMARLDIAVASEVLRNSGRMQEGVARDLNLRDSVEKIMENVDEAVLDNVNQVLKDEEAKDEVSATEDDSRDYKKEFFNMLSTEKEKNAGQTRDVTKENMQEALVNLFSSILTDVLSNSMKDSIEDDATEDGVGEKFADYAEEALNVWMNTVDVFFGGSEEADSLKESLVDWMKSELDSLRDGMKNAWKKISSLFAKVTQSLAKFNLLDAFRGDKKDSDADAEDALKKKYGELAGANAGEKQEVYVFNDAFAKTGEYLIVEDFFRKTVGDEKQVCILASDYVASEKDDANSVVFYVGIDKAKDVLGDINPDVRVYLGSDEKSVERMLSIVHFGLVRMELLDMYRQMVEKDEVVKEMPEINLQSVFPVLENLDSFSDAGKKVLSKMMDALKMQAFSVAA